MIKEFSFTDKTGRIVQYALCRDSDADLTASMNEMVKIEGHYDSNDYYLKENKVTKRPSMDISLSNNVLKGIPKNATVYIDQDEHQADGSDIELFFEHSGRYQIRVENFPFRNFIVEVENENNS